MNIGIVISNLPSRRIGGAQVQAWGLARELAKKNEVTVFTGRPDHSDTSVEKIDGVNLVYQRRLPRLFFWPFPFLFHIFTTVRAVCLNASQLDVLLCFMATPSGIIGNRVYKRTGIPYCVSIRGRDWYGNIGRTIGEALLKIALNECATVLVQSDQTAADVSNRFPFSTVSVVPNGITLQNVKPEGESVLYAGSLMKHKGVDVLLEALREESEMSVHIVGDGPERKRLERIAKGQNVVFHGAVKHGDVSKLLADNARILVLPSIHSEGFPNVLMEAMAVGVPIVATDVPGGVRDLLQNGKLGVLVAPGDPEALHVAVCELMSDSNRCEQLSRAGKAAVSDYSWEHVAELYEAALHTARSDVRQ